ncbi:hypothetical protein [Spirillospora sp. NPDC029432]|uniref:hypothetical protein n=1 Tax=Spirillospora sp. NPDC029432 TaxID=3154599 RepID=UPI003453B766
MSFGNFARKARDPSLPHRKRVSMLRSCVQLYRPIGFHATLSFLEARAGRFQEDEAALLRALDELEASRAVWHAELAAYDETRRAAKRRGIRSPRPRDPNPYHVDHWYGARREAALHAVLYWNRRRLPALVTDDVSRDLRACVNACLESGGRLAPDERRTLAACAGRLRSRMDAGRWEDRIEYFRTRDLLTIIRLLEDAAGAPPEPGSMAG